MTSALIIEDEPIVAMELESRLAQLGLEVVGTASNHPEAMSLAEAHPPDIVLADVRIAGSVGGMEVAGLLRARFGSIVIIVSAHADPATRRSAAAAGASGFVVKPFGANELEAAIASAREQLDRSR